MTKVKEIKDWIFDLCQKMKDCINCLIYPPSVSPDYYRDPKGEDDMASINLVVEKLKFVTELKFPPSEGD